VIINISENVWSQSQYTHIYILAFVTNNWFLAARDSVHHFIAVKKICAERHRDIWKGGWKVGWNWRDRESLAMMALRLAVKSQQSLSRRKRGKQYLLHTSVIPLPARKLWILRNASLLSEAIFFPLLEETCWWKIYSPPSLSKLYVVILNFES